MEIDKEIEKDKLIKKIIVTVYIGLNIFVLADMFFKIFTFQDYSVPTYTLLFTMLFGVIIYSLVLAILGKSSKATTVICIFIFLLSLINQTKILYTGEPLFFSDINFITKSGDLLQLAIGNIAFESIFLGIIGFLIFFIILGIIIFFSFKYNLEIKSKKVRIMIMVIDLLILLLLFIPNAHTKDLYLKVFFNTNKYKDFNSYTTNLSYYYRNGLINGMYGVYLNNIFTEPENYDENHINELLNNVSNEKNNIGKPNIIVIFSESFWDVGVLDEVKFSKNVTTNFNELKNKGKFVNLLSPAYGGMSENVSFELFTSGSMNYFPKGYIPVMSLYNRNNSDKIPSLVKVLKDNGYYSKIVFGKDYYNSEEAYTKIGFDEYEEISRSTSFIEITDEVCTDFVIKEFEEKNNNKPMLYVIATIESHMPYTKEKYENYDIEITQSNLSETMNETLLAYSQGIYNSDKQLGRLYEYIQNYEEPTILLFLGDHLPYLYTSDYKNVIDNLEYFNTDDDLLNQYRKYNTQALILSNYDISNINIKENLGTDLLLNSIVNQLDIKNEKYYEWLYSTKDTLAGSNSQVSLDKNGKIYYTSEITEEMKKVYEQKNQMQYKFFIKKSE